MIRGDLKSSIDRVWDSSCYWGISSALSVIVQITYLAFVRLLADLQTLAESKARFNGGVIEDSAFRPGQTHLRWSRFRNDPARSSSRRAGTAGLLVAASE